MTVDGVNNGAPCNDMANGRADGAHKLAAPRPSVTERYLGGRPDLCGCLCVFFCIRTMERKVKKKKFNCLNCYRRNAGIFIVRVGVCIFALCVVYIYL